jgi:hypothetical protein
MIVTDTAKYIAQQCDRFTMRRAKNTPNDILSIMIVTR